MSKLRIYFASDVHASDLCWKKFLAAPKFYQATIAIMGGDVTGKVIVPIVRERDGRASATFNGIRRQAETKAELAELRAQIANSGAYVYEVAAEDLPDEADRADVIHSQFQRLALERVADWVAMAEAKLAGSGVRCLVNGGNDDPFEVDDLLRGSTLLEVPDGTVIELESGVDLIGLGYANLTPWNCARDISEEELGAKIDDLAQRLANPEHAVFDIHVPPYDSGLDRAPMLDENLSMVMGAHGPVLTSVGSTAVSSALARYQPTLSLHGHVHESRGVKRLAGTVAVNPGSEYREGVLNGAVAEIDTSRHTVAVELVSG